ncbi:hypothetical protein Taro_055159 [Colocasia esculenta]|uniref:Exostosin GT47 domain-containing protein n=1 Tax=Colocasia esculenta TaxID=4460 RepID=A0A843XSH9_COLES|nr:hypothetical protein [Colocasia esculenta]
MAPPPSLLPFLFLVFAAVCNARSDPATATRSVPDECAGRRIHIRRLPPRFNEQLLLNCPAYHPLYDDFCPYLANGALGHKTHNGSRSWYRTDPIVLEPLFHRRLLEYPCLAPDPSAADAVFLPYYAALDALRYLYGPEVNSSHEHGLNLFDFLSQDHPGIWARRGGHDHFLVMAGRAWDFSQDPAAEPPVWGTSFLELPEFYNVTALVLESRAWPWQEQAIPYPTSFHPANLPLLESWIARARRSRRTVLMMFAGGGGSPNSAPNIRRSIRAECENRTSHCEMVDCSNGVCEHDPIRFMRPMLRASFCLQPPGDTPTRRATFDGIIAGCIPVFFEEATARSQYGWHLPPPEEYPSFSVHIPKEDVVGRGLSIADVLLGIPAVEVGRMRERVLEMAPRVLYRRHRSSPGLRSHRDAIDLAVEGALQRISGRLRSLQAGNSLYVGP